MLPTGLICPASEGIAGIRPILDELAPAFSQAFCKNPLDLKYAHNAETDPTHMSSRWLSRRWIQDALNESFVTPGWAYCDLWLPIVCTTISCRPAVHHLPPSGRAIIAMSNEHTDAYNAMYPLSGIPLELAGELYYIRPPSVKSWDKTLFLSSWVTAKSMAPSTRQYLIQQTPNK
jgi:hypothetical protein